jgi:hypothetical protein
MRIWDRDSSKWLIFSLYEDTGKTLKYNIYTKEMPMLKLGEVKWFGRWRQYAFFPEPETVFEKHCMKDITNFLELLMEERKNKKAETFSK